MRRRSASPRPKAVHRQSALSVDTTVLPAPAAQPPSPHGTQFSRHLVVDENADLAEHSFRIRSYPRWWAALFACIVAAVLEFLDAPCTSHVCLVVALRVGPVNVLIRALPAILSWTDFENRRYRVMQSMWLVSGCVSIYTLLPEEKVTGPVQGWKLNLVTMETSMASGIAASYGYSVAGGVPGGLLAEHVMADLGVTVSRELTPFLGPVMAKAITGFGLFYLMGSLMHAVAKCAYAFAHQRPTGDGDFTIARWLLISCGLREHPHR